jgi:hypothetical protein
MQTSCIMVLCGRCCQHPSPAPSVAKEFLKYIIIVTRTASHTADKIAHSKESAHYKRHIYR